jgi:hypothetical protein
MQCYEDRCDDGVGEHLDVRPRSLSAGGSGGGMGEGRLDIVLDLRRRMSAFLTTEEIGGGLCSKYASHTEQSGFSGV